MSRELVMILKYLPTIILVGVTIWYAVITQKILKQERLNSAAKVFFRIGVTRDFVFLTIENTGKLPARNLHVKLADDDVGIKPFRKTSLRELPFLTRVFSYFPPGDSYRYRLGYTDVEFIRENDPELGFSIRYMNGLSQVEDKYSFKLLDYLDMIQLSFIDPVGRITDALAGIRNELKDDSYSEYVINSMTARKCPYCREFVPTKAKKCKHCQEWLPEQKDMDKGDNGDA